MNNEINLKFDKSTTRLAGFPYGLAVFNEQVKNRISFNEEVTIIFPEQIEKVASSFVQGFFSIIVEEIGYKGIEEKINIKTCSDVLTDSIRKNIY